MTNPLDPICGFKDDPVYRRWRKWKHLGEDVADDAIYDEDYEPDWMKTDEAGWAIGRRIYDKSEIEVIFDVLVDVVVVDDDDELKKRNSTL